MSVVSLAPRWEVRRFSANYTALAGLVWNDRGLYVYDAGAPAVVRLDIASGREAERYGREGRGPLEFGVETVHPGVRTRRLADGGSHFVLWDMRRSAFHRFAYSGTDYEKLGGATSAHASYIDKRIYAAGDTVFLGAGYFSPATAGRSTDLTFQVLATVGDSVWSILERPMRDLPTQRGTPMVPREQALPLWAAERGCVYFNDGHSLLVERLNRITEEQSVVPLAGADTLELGAVFQSERYAAAGWANWPEPTLTAHVNDMSVDPAGGIWLQLVATHKGDNEGILVGHIDRLGQSTIRWLPLFPRAFGPNGELAGIRLNDMEEPEVWVISRK